jgi:iron complex outermembrane recepter protein
MGIFMNHRKQTTLRRNVLAQALVVAISLPLSMAAMAQDSDAEDTKEKKETAADTKEIETVKVTGSLISRLGFDTASPVQIINGETSATVGQLETADILQSSSVAAGSTQFSNQFSGFVIEGGNGVQTVGLRGLGPSRTLVLVDGKRPGPAGTRGQVGAFDLNVIPSSIVSRYEILKDAGGSIYGSDAIGGVINVITRKSVDKTTLTASLSNPLDGGGETLTLSGATGWNFEKGGIVASFELFDSNALKVGDRDFFGCSQDLVRNANGELIDRVDRSILAGTPLAGCSNLYANTVISGATRYIPSPNGVTIGPIPGYRPRANGRFNPATGAPAFYEDVLNFNFLDERDIFSEQDRASVFVSADFSFDNVDWNGQFLYTNRETKSRSFRQFFPTMNYASIGLSPFSVPIMPFPSNNDTKVEYFYVSSGFKGKFGSESDWSWNLDTTFSRSDGQYNSLDIDSRRTGDRNEDPDGGPPAVNYLEPRFLNGTGINELVNAIGVWHKGETTYDQFVFNATATGTLFKLPAGDVGAAFGAEFRRISIDDNPSELERNGLLWGTSSASGTEGTDKIYEVFAEIEAPLLSGLPGVEQLTFNASARAFKYDSVEDSDSIWKAGLLWQIIPSLSFRATKATAYRAPGLYELYLGDQTGFVGQLADPCVDLANSPNPNAIANCTAAGLTGLTGAGSSITVTSRGGLGLLKPETSKSFTAGIVFTPASANFSVSLDYFEIEVNDQISQLGAGAILGGCYGLPVFPNGFCNFVTRNGAASADPFTVDTVLDSYININQQITKGYDLNLRWDGDFKFGQLEVESQFTYTKEASQQLFESGAPSGFENNDFNGTIGSPKLVGNVRTALNRGDWTYTWGMEYVSETNNFFFVPPATYFGNPNPVYDSVAQKALYHNLSVRYSADDWSVLVGVNNVLDKDPPTISTGVGSARYGNVPAFATQYDQYGRSLFARFSYNF